MDDLYDQVSVANINVCISMLKEKYDILLKRMKDTPKGFVLSVTMHYPTLSEYVLKSKPLLVSSEYVKKEDCVKLEIPFGNAYREVLPMLNKNSIVLITTIPTGIKSKTEEGNLWILNHACVDVTKNKRKLKYRYGNSIYSLYDSNAYVKSITERKDILKCNECGKTGTKLMRCTGCLAVMYCSSECQLKAWKKEHKSECKSARKVFGIFCSIVSSSQ